MAEQNLPTTNPILVMLVVVLLVVLGYGVYTKEKTEAILKENNAQLYAELCRKQGGTPYNADDQVKRLCLVGSAPISVINP